MKLVIGADVIGRAADELGAGLPRIAAAIVLLVVGILVARLVGRLLTKALAVAGVDGLAERFGVAAVLERARLSRSLSTVLGRAIRFALTVTVVLASVSLLGLQFLSESLNQAVLFVPRLLLAGALILAGITIGALTRERVDRAAAQMDLPISLGKTAEILIIGVFGITAAAQVTISVGLLMVLVAILLGGTVTTIALAFGLGGRDVAAALTAGRYVRAAHPPGQRLRVGDTSGTVAHTDGTATVLNTDDGATLRVPNSLLITSVVLIEDEPLERTPETDDSVPGA
jgi:small-conductance mechanosensitive channel